MITDVKNVQYLIGLLKQYNISHLVLSAGTKNVPFVHSVENDPFFHCYSVVDERSAAFFALGLIQQLQEPVVISCTSGTATCNYLSAVSEAFYRKLPLIVVTSDRHPYYLNQAEEQMIPQQFLYERVCKKSVNLPVVKDSEDEWYCKRVLNEALLEVTQRCSGPVHINMPLEGSEQEFHTEKLPYVRKWERLRLSDSMEKWAEKAEKLKQAKRVLVIYGQSNPISKDETRQIENFFRKYNCIIAVDQLSNLHCEGALETFFASRTIVKEEFGKYLPDIVITVNGNYLSYIRTFLKANANSFEHWVVCEDGEPVDPFKSLSTIFECSTQYFFKVFAELSKDNISQNSYYDLWKKLIEQTKFPEVPFSDLYAVQQLITRIPANSILNLSNSSSVRIAQHFKLDDSVSVYCNRGTNGIDGSLSTFVGQTAVVDQLSFMIIGDLSFFYDMNALWNNHVKKNARIMLNNNGGATIFHFNIGKDAIPTLDKHTAAEHYAIAKNWVESRGFRYLTASNKEEFDKALPEFLKADSEQPIFFEVFTDKVENAKLLRWVYNSNKSGTAKAKDIAKNTLKKFLVKK